MKEKKFPTLKKKMLEKDMMETFNVSPWYSVGKILPTSTKRKADVFDSYRPTKQCVDYKISETWAKLQGQDVKINIKQTTATYADIPPEMCKPKRKKKIKLFSGGPPQWKFVDELWRKDMDGCQKRLMQEHRKIVHEAQTCRANKFKHDHGIVQRLVGPEWFMELSPQQLKVVDMLKDSVYLDLRNGTSENCKDILDVLGLVKKTIKKHIVTALQHSCGCPVEFLLVLYQIIDPKRQSYSLNDRLLLSAAVHLSITETLRELHRRIPSPPKIAENTKKPKKKPKKVKYSSPYLEPLTYQPRPPKYTGIYKNKHKQYPQSPYFSYLVDFEDEKRCHEVCLNYSMLRSSEEKKAKIAECKGAQEFFGTLPGAKEQMLNLIFPTQKYPCPNLLNPRKEPPPIPKFITPKLCKVSSSEPVICFCEENLEKRNANLRTLKRSSCEKRAQEFLNSICLCDDCLENVAQKSLIRIHGGFLNSPQTFDDPVPLIQGTLLNKTCDCYKEYRNKIVGAAGRQFLTAQKFKYVVGGVVITKIGPIYNVLTAVGEKICLCGEIRERKKRVNHIKATLWSNKAKFAIGGIIMSKIGPVFNLTAVVARKPCKCILNYREELKILTLQNGIRKNPSRFVNHGLISGPQGPVYHFSSYVVQVPKSETELQEVCCCEIRKPTCFQRCNDYLEYKISCHTPPPSSGDSESSSEETESESKEANSSDQSGQSESDCSVCSVCSCVRNLATESNTVEAQSDDSSSSESETLSGELETEGSASNKEKPITSDQAETTDVKTGDSEDSSKLCRCKEELDRFMKAKCPCDSCNDQIRQGFATYVMAGARTTSSGNQINVVQGIHQPLCSCLHEHQENVRKIDEYRSRVKARYNLRKQPQKYCISGVKNTPNGPVYIISGLRPPVQCECAKAMWEKEEQEKLEKQRAKMPNTGRMKYEIAGVKAMPEENVYILSRALNIAGCKCNDILAKFEEAHKPCFDQLEQYLKQTEEEILQFDEEINDSRRGTVIDEEHLNFDFESHPVQSEPIQSDFLHNNTYSEILEDHTSQPSDTLEKAKKSKGSRGKTTLESADYTSSDDDGLSSDGEMFSSESSESVCENCHLENSPEVRPITLSTEKPFSESFVSKRFAIFRKFPKDAKTQMKILQHILKGMAEDGFQIAKLPQVYKLPIFKLWFQKRAGVYWDYEDRLRYFGMSKHMWKHTMVCYGHPRTEHMPFTIEEAQTKTWKDANLIKRLAAERMHNFYRKVKQVTVDTGREFFAPTFSYEFPTATWRECAFAYLPDKEEQVFAYKVVKPHDTRIIPDNKKVHCYC